MKDAFRAAAPSDIEAIFSLYEKRVRWMDENGVRQWNVTDYLTVYPAAYYREQQAAGRLFALYDGDAPIGAVVLLDEDPLWPDGLPACYIHNLVTDPAVSDAGRRILRAVEALAARRGVRRLRLDCAADNAFLNDYYASMGYELAGRCVDGPYEGNLREKKQARE